MLLSFPPAAKAAVLTAEIFGGLILVPRDALRNLKNFTERPPNWVEFAH